MYFAHNRYAIYNMKGKRVRAKFPRILGGNLIKGLVTKVFRDVMTKEIELTVDGGKYRVKEPELIIERGNCVFFIYGDPYKMESTDADVFHKLEEITSRGGTINDALKETKISDLDIVCFSLKEEDDS